MPFLSFFLAENALLDHLVDHARVGFAAGFFHDLSYKEANGFILTRFDIRNRLRIGSKDFVDHGLDSASVAHLFKAQFLNKGSRSFVGLEHFRKDFLGKLARKDAFIDEVDHFPKMGRETGNSPMVTLLALR